MKDIMKYYLQLITLVFCLSVSACSDDDETTTPVFPDLQKIECEVGDTKTLTFEAADNWILTSSSLWCYFEQDGERTFVCSGNAGKQTVTIHISDDATELLKSYKAELTMKVAGNQQVIAEVTRPSTGYELHVFDAGQTVEYTAEHPYIQDYDGKESFVVSSNTDWIVESSESLDLSNTNIFGEAGDKVKIIPFLKQGAENRKAAWSQELIFKNRKGEIISKLPVHYDGIPEDKVEFSINNPLGTTITFAYNGWTYTLDSKKADAPMPVTVTARDDKYTVVYVEYTETRNDLTWNYEYECNRMSEDESWLFADDDKEGNLSVGMMQNNGKARNAYLMAFPNAVYETVKDNFEDKVFSTDEGIVSEYAQYVAARLNQEANPKFTTGFAITDSEGNPLYDQYNEAIEAISCVDAGICDSDEEAIQKYGTSNAYILSLPLGKSYDFIVAKPNGFTGYYVQYETKNQWNDVSVDAYSMLEISISGISATTNGDNMMQIEVMNNSEIFAVLLIERNRSTE